MGMELQHNVQSLKMLRKLKEVNAWLYIPCRCVKEMDETKSSQLRRKKKPMVLDQKGLKSGLKSQQKGLKHAQQQEL